MFEIACNDQLSHLFLFIYKNDFYDGILCDANAKCVWYKKDVCSVSMISSHDENSSWCSFKKDAIHAAHNVLETVDIYPKIIWGYLEISKKHLYSIHEQKISFI